MSLYNALFGTNAMAGLALAALDLTPDQVGRFRDAYFDKGEDGVPLIVVYTRNGGGNRNCWHDDGDGSEGCVGKAFVKEVDEYREIKDGFLLRYEKTGKRVMETRNTCEQPDSAGCACGGCVVNYRLPQHPMYLRDSDDDFDCTYATIWFKVPAAFAGVAAAATAEGGHESPGDRWARVLAGMRAGDMSDPETKRAFEVGEKILGPVVEHFKGQA